MISVRSILCPTDFSEHSRHALEHAIALARWSSAELVVMHVAPSLPSSPDAFLTGPVAVPLSESERKRLFDALARFARPAEESGVKLRIVLEEGRVAERILAQVDASGANLIVLGTHGEGGFARLVLGSIAAKVLRLAHCPVVTVPPGEKLASPDVLFQTVLAAVDFSPASLDALVVARSLADGARAHLLVLHILETVPVDDPRALLHFGSAEFLSFLEVDARRRLEELAPSAEVLVAAGKPYREILRVAKEREAGFIVMGVQGRGAVSAALFGSTADHVVRSASCPVLTVRQTTPAARAEAPVSESVEVS
jgi:nucleotide-binding universal stress UspA family protein